MSTSSERQNIKRQPDLAGLLSRYLHEQASAHQAGLAYAETGDVVPHEAAVAQPVDPRLAWEEACAVIRYFLPQQDLRSWSVPADWSLLVACQESIAALPLCLGNFPQQVRDLPGLFRSAPLSAPNASDHPSSAPASLLAWAEKASWQMGHPHPLLVVATLRLAGDMERASELLERHQRDLPKTWKAAWANETAALAWHRGQADEATRLWEQQAYSIPVFFNRGLAALTAGRNEDALTS